MLENGNISSIGGVDTCRDLRCNLTETPENAVFHAQYQAPCAAEKTTHPTTWELVWLLPEPLFEQWELKRRALFPSPFARGIIRKAFGEGPHGVI